jgi:hypothetical protein
MFTIEPVTVYEVDGMQFASLAKAVDHIECSLDKRIKALLIPQGFTANECFKVSCALLNNRAAIASLLSYGIKAQDD